MWVLYAVTLLLLAVPVTAAPPKCAVVTCHDDSDCAHLPGCTWCRDDIPGPSNQKCGGPPSPSQCGTLPGPATNPSSLQYECFGDSVSKGIFKVMAPNLTKMGWEPFHPSSDLGGGCGNTQRGVDCSSMWLDGLNHSVSHPVRKWDIITFNYGLHDLAHDGEFLTIAQYKANLLNITTVLSKAQGRAAARPKLFWITTTPIPDIPLTPPRNQSDVPLYNAAAAEVIGQFPDIKIVDAYSFMLKLCGGDPHYKSCPQYQQAGVHFEPAGYEAMSSFITQEISAALAEIAI